MKSKLFLALALLAFAVPSQPAAAIPTGCDTALYPICFVMHDIGGTYHDLVQCLIDIGCQF